MTDIKTGSVSKEVTEQQLRELRVDLWMPLVLLIPLLAVSLWTANAVASAFLGATIAAVALIAVHRSRDPSGHLWSQTGPIAAEITRTGGLELRPGEDVVALRLRLTDTIDSLSPRRLDFGRVSRRIALAATFTIGLAGVGLLTALPPDEALLYAVVGAVVGIVMTEWPKRRQAAKAISILEAQLRSVRPSAMDQVEATPGAGTTPPANTRASGSAPCGRSDPTGLGRADESGGNAAVERSVAE